MNTHLSFFLFVLLMTATPGPGNLTMMALGQQFGIKKCIPLLAGSTLGFHSICWLSVLGLAPLLFNNAPLFAVIQCTGAIYIIYLGWKILHAHTASPSAPPVTGFTQGFLIHPLSPKSWAMCIIGFAQLYTPGMPVWHQSMIFMLSFLLGQFTFHILWCMAGSILLTTIQQKKGRYVSAFLVALMIFSTLYAMLHSQFS